MRYVLVWTIILLLIAFAGVMMYLTWKAFGSFD